MCVCVCLIYGVCSITIYRPPTQLLNPRPPTAQPPPPPFNALHILLRAAV
jgi:hypothetical protein